MIPLDSLRSIVRDALMAAGANDAMAASTARALVAADAQGLSSHGVSRVPQYATHLGNGRAIGTAIPRVARENGGTCLVDAGCGHAFPACELAVAEAIQGACTHGVSFAGIKNSHHFGVAALHLAPVARATMVGLAFSNSPSAMPTWCGKRALFGTNPIAAVFPRQLLCCALTGAHMGFEADSFFVADGNQPRIGQAFLAIDPDALAGSSAYFERIETLVAAMELGEGVRIPGHRRDGLAASAQVDGVSIPDALLAQLRELAEQT